MFTVLKPIIEKNKLFDEKIADLCKDVIKEVQEIEQIPVNQYIQDRLDNIRNLIDCLESDHDFTLESEIDDLKSSFDDLFTAKIERDHYANPDTVYKLEDKLCDHLKWTPTKD